MNPRLRKAAVLINCLDVATSRQLLAQLSETEAKAIRAAAAQLDDVDPIEQQEVLDEFFQREPAPVTIDQGGVELAVSSVDSLDVQPARPPLSTPRPAASFEFLREIKAETLIELLADEHPQTIALVLGRLAPEHASEALLCLPKQLQPEIVRRLVELDEANLAALDSVMRNLETRLRSQIESQRRRDLGLATVKQIFKAAGPLAETELCRNLQVHDAQLATLVTGRVSPPSEPKRRPAPTLLFDDLKKFGDLELAKVVAASEPQHVRLALAGTSTAFVERILRLLPRDGAKTLRQAIENLGALPLSDIALAQDEIVATAEQLRAAAPGRDRKAYTLA